MNTIKVNTDKERFDLGSLVGKKAVFTTHNGLRLVGTIEAKSHKVHTPLIVRIGDTGWAGLGSVIELVVED